MDAQRILYTGKLKGMGFQMSSELSLFQGRAAQSAGNKKAYATLINGAAGASSAYASGSGGETTTTQDGSVSQSTMATSPNQGYGGGEGGARGY